VVGVLAIAEGFRKVIRAVISDIASCCAAERTVRYHGLSPMTPRHLRLPHRALVRGDSLTSRNCLSSLPA